MDRQRQIVARELVRLAKMLVARSPYSGVISPILKRIGRTDIDPRHVEAYLRMESDTGTLDAWPISKFQKLVPEMVDVIDADPVQAERLTKTMGL